MRVEDEFMDVLQNIEFAIVATYRHCPDLVDHDVSRVLEAVTDTYKAEKIGRPPRACPLSDDERRLFEAVRGMCEWRLGRGEPEELAMSKEPPRKGHTVDEILLCLKRLVKSAHTWNREGGTRGYLDFIIQCVH